MGFGILMNRGWLEISVFSCQGRVQRAVADSTEFTARLCLHREIQDQSIQKHSGRRCFCAKDCIRSCLGCICDCNQAAVAVVQQPARSPQSSLMSPLLHAGPYKPSTLNPFPLRECRRLWLSKKLMECSLNLRLRPKEMSLWWSPAQCSMHRMP